MYVFIYLFYLFSRLAKLTSEKNKMTDENYTVKPSNQQEPTESTEKNQDNFAKEMKNVKLLITSNPLKSKDDAQHLNAKNNEF